MVKLRDVRAANAELVKSRDLVCVSAGGTSGVGETTLRELASLHGSEKSTKTLRIYIIARRPEAAQTLVDDLKRSSPNGEFITVEATDLSLLQQVDTVAADITRLERERSGARAKIDLMIMSLGFFQPFEGRTETSEGLESKMSLHYYSRMRLIWQLLPLLTARITGEPPAQVISVYAAGSESGGKMFTDDLSLRKGDNYSFNNSRTTVVHMKTMFFEHLANDHPGKLSLVHVFPGLVITEAMKRDVGKDIYPLWFRVTMKTLLPIARLTFATPVPESGQRTLFLASSRFPAYCTDNRGKGNATTMTASPVVMPVATSTTGVLGGGAYSCTVSGETNDITKAYTQLRADGFYDQVWAHMMDVFNTIEAGKKFTE